MRAAFVLMLLAGGLLAACGSPAPPSRGHELPGCDDGGDGGVVIRGVCL